MLEVREATSNPDFEPLLAHVQAARGIDFRDYRRDAIARGITARMFAHGTQDPLDYLTSLQGDPREIGHLLAALVVPCTGFFRDRAVFTALATSVLPALFRQRAGPCPLRAWCIGTATGEEAWSLAMLLADAHAGRFSLLASDLDRRALGVAEAGTYPGDVAVPEPYRSRYCQVGADGLTIAPRLRAGVRFAYHDLMGPTLAPAEAVIASFDLVVVRNVLIYFDRRLQQKALERITATLEPGSVLVMGPVESMPASLSDRFVAFPAVAPTTRIYRYLGA